MTGPSAHVELRRPAGLLPPARVRAAGEIAAQLGAAALVIASEPAVRWLGVPEPAGVLVLASGGDALLVAPDGAQLAGAAAELRYGAEGPAAALAAAFGQAGLVVDDVVALEADAVPLSVTSALFSRPWIDAGPQLAAARMRKDADELARIAAAAGICDAGHAALRAAAREGVTELELWSAARAAMEARKGRPLCAIADLMAGARTELVGLPPSGAPVAAGAPILFDLAPRHDGWWADSCTTFACGAPSARAQRVHDAVRAALDAGIAVARPGARAGDVDATVRARLDDAGLACPHHIGHGVGTAAQEQPWLRPGVETVLEEGMVLALEPGAYGDGLGVRLEHLLAIEADGARPLTTHSLSLTDR